MATSKLARAEAQSLRDAREYESAAEWCARRGLTGKVGDPLPVNLSGRVARLIAHDALSGSFQATVKLHAYALAMEARRIPDPDPTNGTDIDLGDPGI